MHTYREARIAYFREVMAYAGGVVSVAAQIAGISRTHFYRLLHQYDVPLPNPEKSGKRYANRGNAAWRALQN